MPLSLEQLRSQIGEQLLAISTLTPQYQEKQQAADAANAARDEAERELRFHESVLAGLKNNLYEFFQATFAANPGALTYEEMGAAMDAAAAANPVEPPEEPPAPPPEEPPPEEPPP